MKVTKHLLFSLLLIISCNEATKAQGFGIRGGYNFASVSTGGIPENVNNNNGFYVGVYQEFPFLIKDFLFAVPEIQYSKQGFSTTTSNVTLDYINIPVLAKIYVVKILSFETGPQLGFKIGDSGSSTYSYNGFDPAWAAGMAVNLPFGLSISGRYVGSFNEVVKDYNAKNKVFQAGISFRFK